MTAETSGRGAAVLRRGVAGDLPARRTGEVLAVAALWLLAAALAGRQAAAVLRLPVEQRLPDLLGRLGSYGMPEAGGPLYEAGAADTPFTGTPFAGLVFTPLARAGQDGFGVVWTFGTLLLVAALGVLAVRAMPQPLSHRARLLAAPVAVILLVVSVPVRNAFFLGQASVIPVLLILGALLYGSRAPRASGLLIGLAAALQPSMLVFVPLLWLADRRREAGAAAGGFAACTLLAWAALPADSWTYWFHHVAGVGLGGASDGLSNQSLHGMLLRLGLSGPIELVLFAVLAVAVAVIGLRRAADCLRDGQLLLGAALAGCVAVAVAPVAWQHQQLWILLAVVGRVGRRSADRLVWPVFVVLVMTLDADALVPHIAWLAPLGENAPLLAALLAACVLPFVLRGSERWDRPERSGPFSRPNLMLELLLIRVGYFAYSYVRSLAPDGRETAEAHGRQILDVQQALGIDIEHGINQAVAGVRWLSESMNFYYGAFHFLVPISLLVGLYLRRPATYRWARASLCFGTLFGLVGFWLYPLAPPRLMPGLGYIDTINGPQNFEDPDFGVLTGISNQYAAMPSLHVGWSLWATFVIIRITPNVWLRLLGVLYPLLTTVVVMGTANHYLLDAAGGAVVIAAGFAAAHFWTRHAPGGASAPGTSLRKDERASPARAGAGADPGGGSGGAGAGPAGEARDVEAEASPRT